MNLKILTVYITQELKDMLWEEHYKTKKSISQIVRECIENELCRKEDKK